MEEKYEIELELITSKFNLQINKIKNSFNSIVDRKIDINKQIKLDNVSRKIQVASNEVDNLNNKLQMLEDEYKTVANSQGNVSAQGTATSNSSAKGINKMMSKIKEFASSLFNIKSVYALVSKASSAYLSQDTQLANKLQAVWIGLGSMFEPIISAIANTLIKGVKYINIFIYALTGVDFLAKAISKSMKNANSSTKALSKSLAGFDELTSLDTSSDSSNSGLDTSWVDAFNEVTVDDDVAKILEDVGIRIKNAFIWLLEHKEHIVKAITIIIGIFAGFVVLKTIIDILSKTKGTFTGLFNGIGKAAASIAILGGISLVMGQITGLITAFSESGISLSDVAILLGSVLGELAIAFVAIAGATKLIDWQGIAGATIILAGFALIINQVTNLIAAFSNSGLKVSDVAWLMATVFGTLVVLMGAIALLGPSMTAGLIPFAVVVAGISALLIVMANTIPIILEACSNFINNTAPTMQKILETIGNLIVGIIYALGTVLPPIINSVGNLFDKIFNGISKVISTVGDTIVGILRTAESLVTTVLSSILNFINDLGPAINNFVDNAIKAVTKLINFMISGIEYLVNTLVIPAMQTMVKAVNLIPGVDIAIPGKMSIPRFVPSYDVGTNYVPEDQLAYIHKGEAVIPKKFNSQEYFGNGNEETNSLLEQVIDAINNIEVNPYTTIKDVGKTAVNYINNRNRQLGGSVIA